MTEPKRTLPFGIAEAIRKRRKDLGLTQAQLAEQAGISRNYLLQIETGQATNPGHAIISTLFGILGLSELSEHPDMHLLTCAGCGSHLVSRMVPMRTPNTAMAGLLYACATCAPNLYGAAVKVDIPTKESNGEPD